MDRSQFRALFEQRLRFLTFNSKDLINELTVLAERNQPHAQDVAELVARRIMTVEPRIKLTTLYLMDSIVKNVKSFYISAFGQRVSTLFLHAYKAGDDGIKRRLKHLLKTWEDSKIFPAETLYQIHEQAGRGEVDRVKYRSGIPGAHARKRPGAPRGPSSSSQQKRVRQHGNFDRHSGHPYPPPRQAYPPPPHVSQHQSVQQVYDLLHHQMRQRPDLQPILQSILDGLNRGDSIQSATRALTEAMALPPRGAAAQPYPRNDVYETTHVGSRYPEQPPLGSDPSDLLQTLNDIAPTLDNILGTNRPAAPEPRAHLSHPSASYAPPRNSAEAFSIFHLKRVDPASISLVYEAIPLKCKTCGLRKFTKDDMAQHLDWHFRMNRRKERRETKVVSREWYMPVSEWATYDDLYAKDPTTTMAMQEEEEEEQAPEIKTVPVPEDLDDAPEKYLCPECQEGFTTEWDDESESWMFVEATKNDNGVIIHQRCQEASQTPKPAATLSADEPPPLEPDDSIVKTETPST